MKKAPQDRKSSTIIGIVVMLMMMLGASGNIITVLVLLMPIIFLVTIFLSIKKGKREYDEKVSLEELRKGVYTAAGDLGQELRRAKEYFEQELMTEDEAKSNRSASAPREYTPRKQAVSPGMLQSAERRHLQSLSGTHNELLHHELELRDLLNAGIIERDEYNDRLRELRNARG